MVEVVGAVSVVVVGAGSVVGAVVVSAVVVCRSTNMLLSRLNDLGDNFTNGILHR